ncbi:MAG TPA: delta-60 repeat domain-containing protein [Candidatus Udaeobacter sp.]|nr:delta-60 repeat domain-containing protein [Candidatus Udaeobacter sp.]
MRTSRNNSWHYVILVAAIIGPFFVAGSTSIPTADGDLDLSFGSGGVVMTDFNTSTDIAYAVALQPDGKLVAAGITYTDNDFSNQDFAIARYNVDGSLDASFGTNGRVTTDFPGLVAAISAVVVQPDGKIVVAGGAYPLFTFAGDFKVARYNPDGSLDTLFGNGGIVTTIFPGDGSFAFALALQSDGKIIAAGTDFFDFNPGDMSDTDFALARYNPDGSPDTTFGNSGTITTDFLGAEDDVYSVLIQSDGKIVAVGSANSPFDYYDFAAARYLANGTLDPTFGTGGKVRVDFGNNDLDIANDAALQPDGKIVAAGTTVFDFGVQEPFALTRFNSNGTVDTTFGNGGLVLIDFGSFLQSANAVLVQPDGKIITVGFPDTELDDSDFLLARCNPNGSLDPSFGAGGKVRTSLGDLNSGANDAVLQPDGKIVAVGFNPTEKASGVEFALARYLAATSGGSPTPTASPTSTPTLTPSVTPSPSPTPTATASPTATPTPTSTATATASPSPTPSATATATATATPRPTPTPRLSPTPRARPTPAPRP